MSEEKSNTKPVVTETADDCTRYICCMRVLFVIYALAFLLPFGYAVFLFSYGLKFNKIFQTTAYTSLLIVVSFLINPLTLFFYGCLSDKRKNSLSRTIIYFTFIIFLFFINQTVHFINFKKNIEPFDFTTEPTTKFHKYLMNFILASFNSCCEDIDKESLLCLERNNTFPCIFDEAKFEAQNIDGNLCEILNEELCDEDIESFAESAINVWKGVLYYPGLFLI